MISFIIEFGEESKKKVKNFLSSFSLYVKNIKNIEIIFITKKSENFLIDEIFNFIDKNPMVIGKVVYSTKSFSINKKLKYATKIATNNYIWIIDVNTIKQNKELLQDLVKIISKSNDFDLLEIKPKLNGLIKWEPKARLLIKPQTKTFIKDNKEIITYSFPFVYNKIFSKKLASIVLDSLVKDDSIDLSFDLSIEFMYNFLLEAKTYIWYDKRAIQIDINESSIPYYKHIFDEWFRVQNKYLNKQKYLQEIQYAKAYHLLIIMTNLYSVKNIGSIFKEKENQLYKKKYYEALSKYLKNEMESFNIENKYTIISNKENILLKKIQPISKWNKLMSFLEN